jgi:hypothetical protein
MIEVQKIIYKKFGNCIQITTKTFCVIVTIDFGPRIICFKPINGNNLLFEDIHDNFKMNDKKHQKLFGHET